MSRAKYTEEFKAEAVGQILERGYSVSEVSERIGVSRHSLYAWIKKDPRNPASGKAVRKQLDAEAEVVRLKAELKRVQEERDILKKAAENSTVECNTINFPIWNKEVFNGKEKGIYRGGETTLLGFMETRTWFQ